MVRRMFRLFVSNSILVLESNYKLTKPTRSQVTTRPDYCLFRAYSLSVSWLRHGSLTRPEFGEGAAANEACQYIAGGSAQHRPTLVLKSSVV